METAQQPRTAIDHLLPRLERRRTRIGLVSGGLAAYWPQLPDLKPQLEASVRIVTDRFEQFDADVIDVGLVSDATESVQAAERLRQADCDLVVIFVATYLTSSMVLPIAQRVQSPVLCLDLQPSTSMDHATFGTGEWLAYCGQCSIPEIANVFRRAGIDFRSVTGHLDHEPAWNRIGRWIRAAGVRGRLRNGRHGLMGHVYPGMLDVSTDLTTVSSTFGSHVEVLEFDDLRELVMAVESDAIDERVDVARSVFSFDDSIDPTDLRWAAQVSVGLDRLVEAFDLDTLAYYHRGLAGELHERLGAGMILGASLLTARGLPAAGEYELRTSIAQLIGQTLGAGGSFTEIQALNFDDGVVEMGHDGPADLAVSERTPLLRCLGVFHGKRGWGVSVEFDVAHGPVTTLGLGQDRDGRYVLVTSEGTVVSGPLLTIGNTTSRVDFGMDPGGWVDAWSQTGIGHHWALCVGHRNADVAAAASLLGIEHRSVTA
jgi:L-arabinose isomerase